MSYDINGRPTFRHLRSLDGRMSGRPSQIDVRAALLALLLSVATGAAAVSDHGRLALAAIAVGLGFVALWRWNVGTLLGILLIAQLGGLGNSPSNFTESLFLAIQLVVMIAYLLVRPQPRLSRADWYVIWAAVPGLVWWTWIAVRTMVFEEGTFAGVLGGGRDLAYVFVLAPLSMLVLKDRRVRWGLIAVLSTSAAVYVIVWLLYFGGFHEFGALLNIKKTRSVYGLSRLYTPTHYIGTVAACFGIALALRGPTRRLRGLGAIFAAAAVLVVILQLTRSMYFGLGVGAIVVCGAWALQGRTVGQRPFQGRILVAVAAVAVVVIGLIVVPVAEQSTLGKVSQRVSTGLESLENGTGSVGTREEEAAPILTAVGGRWLTGLGFWTPSTHYFSGAPNGEIRNGDLGILNIYATEGLVGVTLLYIPLLGLLIVLIAFPSWGGFAVHRSNDPDATPSDNSHTAWLMLGTGIWLATILASSITIRSLASRPGASVSSYVIGAGLATLITTPPTGPFSRWNRGNELSPDRPSDGPPVLVQPVR